MPAQCEPSVNVLELFAQLRVLVLVLLDSVAEHLGFVLGLLHLGNHLELRVRRLQRPTICYESSRIG